MKHSDETVLILVAWMYCGGTENPTVPPSKSPDIVGAAGLMDLAKYLGWSTDEGEEEVEEEEEEEVEEEFQLSPLGGSTVLPEATSDKPVSHDDDDDIHPNRAVSPSSIASEVSLPSEMTDITLSTIVPAISPSNIEPEVTPSTNIPSVSPLTIIPSVSPSTNATTLSKDAQVTATGSPPVSPSPTKPSTPSPVVTPPHEPPLPSLDALSSSSIDDILSVITHLKTPPHTSSSLPVNGNHDYDDTYNIDYDIYDNDIMIDNDSSIINDNDNELINEKDNELIKDKDNELLNDKDKDIITDNDRDKDIITNKDKDITSASSCHRANTSDPVCPLDDEVDDIILNGIAMDSMVLDMCDELDQSARKKLFADQADDSSSPPRPSHPPLKHDTIDISDDEDIATEDMNCSMDLFDSSELPTVDDTTDPSVVEESTNQIEPVEFSTNRSLAMRIDETLVDIADISCIHAINLIEGVATGNRHVTGVMSSTPIRDMMSRTTTTTATTTTPITPAVPRAALVIPITPAPNEADADDDADVDDDALVVMIDSSPEQCPKPPIPIG